MKNDKFGVQSKTIGKYEAKLNKTYDMIFEREQERKFLMNSIRGIKIA